MDSDLQIKEYINEMLSALDNLPVLTADERKIARTIIIDDCVEKILLRFT